MSAHAARFPLLGPLEPGSCIRREVTLPGAALAEDRWPVIGMAGVRPGPAVFINAGIHGGEYPSIEAVIRFARLLDPQQLAGTVVLMPVVNLPAFRQRQMFVCPLDGLNPNRVFPGNPTGSYSEQMVHALLNEFIGYADYYIDLHGGDIVEDLVPFTLCRRGESDVDQQAAALAEAFGLPNLVTVAQSVQAGKGTMGVLAAIERGVPAIIAEAGGVGQLQAEAVTVLLDGLVRALNHLGVADLPAPPAPVIQHFTHFEWIYTAEPGMFYPAVTTGDDVTVGQALGRVGSLFGDELAQIVAPVSGRVLFLTTSPAVVSGGLLMGIGVA